MPLLFSIPMIKEEIIQALNWTLLHSLWQGMLLAVVAGSIVFFTKKASPSLRYNLLTGSLLIFVIIIAATLNIQLIKAKQLVNTVQAMPAVQVNASEPAMSPMVVDSNLAVPAKAIAFFNTHAKWVVLAWLLIIGLQFIRLTAGLVGVYQLKRRQIFSPGEYWCNRIIELSRQLQINKRVRLLQSGIVRMPAVIGYFKPVILFPAAMLASLPANEIEAILIHELAHIRRKDFLVNLLQQVVEIIFFFNPAVLWVSSLIKSERENCCDDIAVNQTDNKRNYIKALMSFQGFNGKLTSPLTNGFAGEKHHLMNRIRRIIYNNNKTLNSMEKKFLAVGMVITSAFIFAFSSNKVPENGRYKNIVSQNITIQAAEKIIADLPVVIDTIPVRESGNEGNFSGKITTTVEGKKYIIVYDNSHVTELHVNGKKIAAANIADYETVTNEVMAEAKAEAEESKREMEESAIELEQSKRELEETNRELEQAKIEMEQDKKEMAIEDEQNRKELELSKIEMEHSKIEMERSKEEMKRDLEHSKLEMKRSKEQVEQSKRELEQSRRQIEQSKKDMQESRKRQERIIADFISEKIITGKTALSSFKLSNEELIVNGIKQPDAVHKKFKDKYVKGNNWKMSYSNINDKEVQ